MMVILVKIVCLICSTLSVQCMFQNGKRNMKNHRTFPRIHLFPKHAALPAADFYIEVKGCVARGK